MQKLFFILTLLINVWVWGQNEDTTHTFNVKGAIQQDLHFTIKDIAHFDAVNIPDVDIINFKNIKRDTAQQLQGVLIKDLLSELKLDAIHPKFYSEYYLVFVAIDGYKVVFSWNEIFNNPVGEQVYLITSRDGKTITEMEESLLILTPTDYKTGRRHIKHLHKIYVLRALID